MRALQQDFKAVPFFFPVSSETCEGVLLAQSQKGFHQHSSLTTQDTPTQRAVFKELPTQRETMRLSSALD